MEHEPIRVGQVREMGCGTRYTVTGRNERFIGEAWVLAFDGGATHTWLSTFIGHPVVGWSREHLPPPVLTANPAEVVEGEVRLDNDTTYRVRRFDDRGRAAISHFGHSVGACRWFPDEIAHDPLISRPGVTL